MDLTAIATALNGQFVPIGEHHGFIESSLSIPRDGTLLGAYLFDCGNGQLRMTDDGETLFNVAAAGASINRSRLLKCRDIASEYGVILTDDGELVARWPEVSACAELPRILRGGAPHCD